MLYTTTHEMMLYSFSWRTGANLITVYCRIWVVCWQDCLPLCLHTAEWLWLHDQTPGNQYVCKLNISHFLVSQGQRKGEKGRGSREFTTYNESMESLIFCPQGTVCYWEIPMWANLCLQTPSPTDQWQWSAQSESQALESRHFLFTKGER